MKYLNEIVFLNIRKKNIFLEFCASVVNFVAKWFYIEGLFIFSLGGYRRTMSVMNSGRVRGQLLGFPHVLVIGTVLVKSVVNL